MKGSDESNGGRRLGPITLAELTAGLIWPGLLRTLGLAVQPPRLLLGFLFVVVAVVVSRLFDAVRGEIDGAPIAESLIDGIRTGVRGFAGQSVEMDLTGAFGALGAGLIGTPLSLLREAPVSTGILLLLLLPAWAVLGGAIARITVVDVAGALGMGVIEAVRFAVARWRSLCGALLIPLVVLGVLALLIAGLGAVMLGIPGLNILGAALYILLLFLGLGMMFVLVGFVLGQALLAPAVVTEGTDALDAVQRAYAYVLGRPGRLLIYAAVLLAQGAIAYLFVSWFISTAVSWTADLSTAWLGAARSATLVAGSPESGTAGGIIAWWEGIARLAFAGFVVSYYFTGSSVLYLLVRRVNDEQDIHDVWMPEMRGESARSMLFAKRPAPPGPSAPPVETAPPSPGSGT